MRWMPDRARLLSATDATGRRVRALAQRTRAALTRRVATVLAVVATAVAVLTVAVGCAPPPLDGVDVPSGSGVSSLPDIAANSADPPPTPWLTPSKSPTPTPTPTTAPSDPGGVGAADTPLDTDPVVVSDSAFGMHVEQRDASAWPDSTVGAYRIWNADSTWGALEPSPGKWSFGALDTRVANATNLGASVLLVLSHPPGWAAGRPDLSGYGGSPSPPKDVAAWRTYVRTVAQRYAGRVEAYEIWNEANLVQFFTGSPGQLAELTIAASQEISAVDPAAKVVSSGLSARTGGAQGFFSSYLGAVPSSAVDVVGIHLYPYPGDGPESMLSLVSDFRSLAGSAGHGAKPMWNTEIGYGRTPDDVFTGDTAASLILRTYLLLPSYGVPRNYWYKWDDRSFVGLYLVNPDRSSASESGQAYATAARWLAGATILGCGEGGGFWRCQVERDGSEVSIVWHLGGEAAYAAPAGTTAMYRFGGGSEPVLAGASVTVGALPVLFAAAEQPGLSG